MTTYRDCIEQQLAKGKITRRKAKEALERYDNILAEHLADGMPKVDAELKAGADALTRPNWSATRQP